MKTFQILSNEIEGRFDPKFYDPIRSQFLKKLEKQSKESDCDLYDLNDLVDFKISAFYESIVQKYSDEGIPFIKVMDVKKLTIGTLNVTHLPNDFKNKKGKITRLKSGDVVISKGGTVGNVAIIPKSMKECLMSRDIIGIVHKNPKSPVTLSYIATFLSSSLGQIQIQNIKTQQNQEHLTLAPLRKIKILVPKKIHDETSKTLMKIELLELQSSQLIEKAIKIFYDVMKIKFEFFSELTYKINSDDLENVFTPSNYHPNYLTSTKKMKKKFETVSLGSFTDIERGNEPGSKTYKILIEKNKTDVPFIRTSDIINYEIDNYPDFVISENIFSELNQDIRKDDILFTNDGKIGLSAMVLDADECIIQSHIRRIRVLKNKHNLSSYYVFGFLNTIFALNQIHKRIIIQSTISTIGNGLQSLLIPILPDDKIKTIEKLIQQAFTLKQTKKLLLKNMFQTMEELV
jgi:type I restriction enzyme, S subunit